MEKSNQQFLDEQVERIVQDIIFVYGCHRKIAELTAVTAIQYPKMLLEIKQLVEEKKSKNV